MPPRDAFLSVCISMYSNPEIDYNAIILTDLERHLEQLLIYGSLQSRLRDPIYQGSTQINNRRFRQQSVRFTKHRTILEFRAREFLIDSQGEREWFGLIHGLACDRRKLFAITRTIQDQLRD